MMMRGKFLALAALVFCGTAMGAPHSIIDAETGMLLGASDGAKWLKPKMAAKILPPREPLRLYDLTGEIGRALAGKTAANEEVCPETLIVALQPRSEKSAIALGGISHPLPRVPRLADLTEPVYLEATRSFLRSRGLKNPSVKITQIIRVDLDGDGEDEVLISATNYLKDQDGLPSSAAKDNYSCVFLRRVVKGQVQTQLIAGDFYPSAKTSSTPNEFRVAAVLDLNGDGRMEVILRSTYYEGGSVSVYECGDAKIREVLSAGCGA